VGHASTRNSQNFFEGSEPWYRHFIGVLGEKAYSAYSGYPVDDQTIGRGDSGVDFPGGVQVKTACLESKPRLMIPQSQYDRKMCEYYVLAWVRSGDYSSVVILGRITRSHFDDIKESATFYVPTYFCMAKSLEPLESQESFRFAEAPRSFSY